MQNYTYLRQRYIRYIKSRILVYLCMYISVIVFILLKQHSETFKKLVSIYLDYNNAYIIMQSSPVTSVVNIS